MTPSSLAPAPDIRRTDPVPAEPRGRARPPITIRSRPRARLLDRSLGISVLLHLILLPILLLVVRTGPREIDLAGPMDEERVEYLDLSEFPAGSAPAGGDAASEPLAAVVDPTAEPSSTPQRREEEPLVFPSRRGTGAAPAPSPSVAVPGAAGSQAGAQSGGGGGVADRLRPGFSDPRLYVDPETESLRRGDTRSDHQRYMEHLQARIDAANDSAYAEARQPNTDWTTRDKEGRRWGLSEKGLHLGGVTIPRAVLPVPRATGTNQKQAEEREKVRQHEEIKAQEAERERRKAREESTKTTRERKDAERKKSSGGGG